MPEVSISVYDQLPYLPITLNGDENPGGDVEIRSLSLGPLSLPINAGVTFPSFVFEQPATGDKRRFTNSVQPFDRTFEFPGQTVQLDRQFLKLSWRLVRLRVRMPGAGAPFEITFEVFNLKIGSPVLLGINLEADLGLVFNASGLNSSASYLKRYEPDAEHLVPLDFKDFSSDHRYFALRWNDPNLNHWLRQLTANFAEESVPTDQDLALRIVFGDPIPEIRLDWNAPTGRTFTLPGLKVSLPAGVRYSVLLRSDGQPTPRILRLIATIPANQTVTASSNFAWERNGDRELQNDQTQSITDPLFKLDFITQREVSLVLLELDRTEFKLPSFFRQLREPLASLNFANPDSLAISSAIPIERLQADQWQIKSRFNTSLFTLPFLQGDSFNQFVSIKFRENPVLDPVVGIITFTADATIGTSDLKFDTEFAVKFNWETFALSVDHNQGIELVSPSEFLPSQSFLGLQWRFKGGRRSDGKFHHFTLVTKDFNYQVQQAPGATIEIDYAQASREGEPITFIVSGLTIASTGVSLLAQVSDRPARLNGLDTRFRFHGSQLEIRDNRIQDFTLAGSGPLPPALVGDAIADIALQFSQRDGGLTLVAGSASLQGEKLLHCQETRFQFSIDGLGLRFVNDGQFHLYFTLTGSAQYSPFATDDPNGALALLGNIQIDLVECPLTGDASVIGKHVQFLIELPKPLSFSFLGCFEMELRGIGFLPQFEGFDNEPAMELSGQIKFAQGSGDVLTAQIDFHNLYIGLPKPGSFLPRLQLKELGVNIGLGEAFSLEGVVEFRDDLNEQGFLGEGKLEIPGLPVFAASFAFLRVRQDEESPWVRAWFIFLEVRQISFYIPYVELYIREVGLGFGYRYTLASIRAADEAGDLGQLIRELRELSRTQGDLSKRDRWAVDLENRGEDPRWTIVARALISQTSATPGSMSLKWLEQAEKFLPCLFLFDAVLAFRSDLTFFMAVRCWLNTNYYGFVNDIDGLRERPLFSGFVLLSVRQKRFLAQLSSNPNGSLGNLPPLPEFVESAVRNGQFSATFLTEPGLVHAELGWPNMLRWGQRIGPLEAEVSGGMIFRVTKHYLLLGISFKARASFSFDAGLDLGIVGVRISARADAAYGARFIGLVDFNDVNRSALYAGIGLELRIRVSIALWIKLLFIKKTFRLSLEVGFTAGLEFGISGIKTPGLRGTGTLFIAAMGRRLQVSVKLGLNEAAVQTALDRTAPFLNVGLEATDADRSIPGVSATQTSRQIRASRSALSSRALSSSDLVMAAISARRVERLVERAAVMAIATAPEGVFSLPDYDIFVMRQPDSDGWGYFVLLPRAEVNPEQSGIEANGFLPVPPTDPASVTADFVLRIPAESLSANFVLQHFRPEAGSWVAPTDTSSIDWKVKWDAAIEQGTNHSPDGRPEEEAAITLQRYLAYAFKTRPLLDATGQPILDQAGAPIEIPVGDPDPVADQEARLDDERVHSPSEAAYEAAVRGAEEQFRSSPFFKRDPDSAYEQVLNQAFLNTTTIYTASGETIAPNSDGTPTEEQANQQAHQLRGMIVQDLIADLRDYADAAGLGSVEATQPKSGVAVNRSIAFQMGLVFRFRTADAQQSSLPNWLQTVTEDAPTVAQRAEPASTAPSDQFKSVRTFNIAAADFAQNPPQFERVQQLTDTNTIAVAWELSWNRPPITGASLCQQDPDHHLLHYQVRRRGLDGNEPEAVYTVKTGSAVHFQEQFSLTEERLTAMQRQGIPTEIIEGLRRLDLNPEQPLDRTEFLKAIDPVIDTDLPTEQLENVLEIARNGQLTSLRPRFQLVDHFTDETLDDQVSLPATGRSYLYTITPIDFAGNAGRPLTLIATRYPSEPPRVPVDGKLTVSYHLRDADLQPPETVTTPQLLTPSGIEVSWREPAALREGPTVPVKQYRLIFRKEATLPIGSYGMDSSTQRPRSRSLPTSNARPLPTDIKIDLQPEGTPQARLARILLATLQQQGIFPAGENPVWQPESWHVFFQTISVNDVPSALAPVQIRLTIDSDRSTEAEERQPAELEWLPQPVQFPLLPPEDQQAIVGDSHFPMPMLDPVSGVAPSLLDTEINGSGHLSTVRYDRHPAGIRLIRFRWNQGASQLPAYPLDLNAGYTLLELDVDAFTRNTFTDPAQLVKALRPIQEVQMIPAEDLLLTPTDTLSTNLWEAWYPSALLRRRLPQERVEGSEIAQGPWYSWRDSYLEFPRWDGLGADRTEALHPFLQAIVDTLDENLQQDSLNGEVLPTFNVDIQFGPPMQPQEFPAFRQATAPKADPYGWGILQRLGLSMAITLRDETTGDLVIGPDLVIVIQNLLEALRPKFADLYPHLHVELLFQPSRSISPAVGAVEANGLLAMVQFSLRPIVHSYLQYGKVTIKGSTRTPIVLSIELDGPCDLIDQANPASGQVQLMPQPGSPTIQHRITLPLKGETTLLLRGRTLPKNITPAPVPTNSQEVLNQITVGAILPLSVTDEQSTYFTVPATLVQELSSLDPANQLGVQWRRLKQYLESINSTDPTQPRITLPTSEEGIRSLPIAEFLNWSQRFFDFSGTVHNDLTGTPEVAGEAWLVTAYPRVSTPAYATPDASGRLKYDHLLENRWAHNYRYYIRPANRYELLWRSLLQSPTLFPGKDAIRGTQLAYHILSEQSLAALQSRIPVNLLEALRSVGSQVFAGQRRFLQAVAATIGEANLMPHQTAILEAVETFAEGLPDPNAGGLDVVIDRTRPVDKPLILSSTRLDVASTAGNPARPGTTWEVIIAQHPEQQLIERNQTLVRQLAFRQVAFSLLRRFAYSAWIKQLENATPQPHRIALQLVENQMPDLPTAYPDQPDHLDLDQPLDGAIVRTLDLPQRIGNFQQGAMVVQWEALPFYYEHRLLLMAQTASTVSAMNETIQRDFEYRAPDPVVIAESVQTTWRPVPPFTGSAPISLRTRRLQIPLQRFWDALPPSAQAQWSSDAPDPKDSQTPGRKPASLPDPDVVYQIVEVFSGNVEVQAEFYFDPATEKFALRQLGQRFLAELIRLSAPTTPQGDYLLDTTLQQISEVELSRSYTVDQVLGNTRSKLAFRERLMSFVGVFRREDRDNILLGSVPATMRPALQALLQAGLTSEDQLQSLFPVLQERRNFWQDFQALERLYQSWFSSEPLGFPANFNLPPTNLSDLQALRNLLNAVPPELAELRDLVDFVEPEDNTLLWTGPRSDADRAALNQLADTFGGDDSFASALRRLASHPDETDLLQETIFLGLERVPGRVRQPQGGQIQFSTNASHQRYSGLTWSGLLFDAQVDILRQWSHLPAFVTAVNQLVSQRDQITLTRTLPPPRPLQSELPDSIRNQLQIDSRQLTWQKPDPTPEQRSALEGLTGDDAFLEARNRLLAEIDRNPDVNLAASAFRPAAATLPPNLRDQLQITSNRLIWVKPDPNSNQRQSLQQLVSGLEEFLTSLRQLIANLDADRGNAASLSPTAFLPDLQQFPASIRDRLSIQNDLLRWEAPRPTAQQRDDLVASNGQIQAFVNALRQLMRAIDLNPSVNMEAVPRRPRSSDIPDSLREQLSLQPERQPTVLRWTGRIHNREQLQTLRNLDGDVFFTEAINTLINELIDRSDTLPFDLPVRPQTPGIPETAENQLPDLIRDRLLIGRVQIRYHGLITVAEGQALQTLFSSRPNQSAIKRLFNTSINRGLQGSQLQVRTRRGSATPSLLKALTPQAL